MYSSLDPALESESVVAKSSVDSTQCSSVAAVGTGWSFLSLFFPLFRFSNQKKFNRFTTKKETWNANLLKASLCLCISTCVYARHYFFLLSVIRKIRTTFHVPLNIFVTIVAIYSHTQFFFPTCASSLTCCECVASVVPLAKKIRNRLNIWTHVIG
jgi:hypothetical protein